MESTRFKFNISFSSSSKRIKSKAAFTLVEMLASLAVLALIMVILAQTFATISSTWKSTTSRGSSFAGARAAFETLRLNLSQATLNTYLGYADKLGNTVPLLNPSYANAAGSLLRSRVPAQYLRASELHFLTDQARVIFSDPSVNNPTKTSGQAVFFQAPAGIVNTPTDRPLGSLLNVLGYYVAFNSSEDFTPAALIPPAKPSIQKRWRYRLMEVIQPAETNAIYGSTCQVDPSTLIPVDNYDLSWIGRMEDLTRTFPNTIQHVLAENIITMALLPKLPPNTATTNGQQPLSTDYSYDSRLWASGASLHGRTLDSRWRNQLPPLMELVIITIDEPSAQRLANLYDVNENNPTPPFSNPALIAKANNLDLSTVFQTYHTQGPPSDLDADIAKVEAGLTALGVSYRIFRTDVAMNNSQWSSN